MKKAGAGTRTDPGRQADSDSLEGAILEGRAAVKRCRRWKQSHPDLFRKLKGCLDTDNCQALESCFQDLFTIYRAGKDLQGLEQSPPPSQDLELPLACRDTYTRGRLRRIGTPRALALARRIDAHCMRKSTQALDAAEKELDRMVDAGSLSQLHRLCVFVRQLVKPKRGPGTQPPPKLTPELKKRAGILEKLCTGRHHIQRVINRINRVNRLIRRQLFHLLPRTCKGYDRLADRITKMGEPALIGLAQRLRRTCAYRFPVEWVLNRMLARRKPGPVTCRLSRQYCADLESRFPDDPSVHVARALTTHRCGGR